jgi:hypothetical protein
MPAATPDPRKPADRRDEEPAPPPSEGYPAGPDDPTLDNESAAEEAEETPGMGA